MPAIGLEITSRKPYAGGISFGDAGPYEQIDGKITFAVDPAAGVNRGIVDLELAPRDSAGRVRFRSDFSLVTPAGPGLGSSRLLVELTNRGRRLFGALNHARPADNVLAGADPGDGFLFRRGWSVGSIGWQWDVIRNGSLLGFDAPPVLKDGLPLSGENIATFRPNRPQKSFVLANRAHKPYPAVRLDDPTAALYVRGHENGEDTLIPRDEWRFAAETPGGGVAPSREHIYLAKGFEPGKIYNLVYEAEGACVAGAGLLAFRDFAALLRRPSALNPIDAGFEKVYGFGISQTGRMLRHFLYLGLNLDEGGEPVFDGVHAHIAGARRGEFNHRFAQPSVSATPSFGHLFPFSDDVKVDPFSEKTDGLLARQRELGGVPKIVYTFTSAEYWRGDAALLHVDLAGEHDLAPAPEARIYHFAGAQHSTGSLPQQDTNPIEGTRGRYGFNLVDYAPLLRAALVNLDAWVSNDVEPPASRHPRLADRNLTTPEQVFETFATIPDKTTPDPERLWRLRALDLGPEADQGVGRYPAGLGHTYPMLVPAVDPDGNELGGIHLPDISVPVATNTGWNPRHPETGSPEQIISMNGSTRFFATTRAARELSQDPRRSLEERYASKEDYLRIVHVAALGLAAARYIVDEDIELLLANASERYDLAIAAAGGPQDSKARTTATSP